jgi:hypothetical protein
MYIHMHIYLYIYTSLWDTLHKQAILYYKGQSFVSSSLLDVFKRAEKFS